MIAMQYGFTLPADYDMTIIERRIAERGHLLDNFPGLRFKAYLYSRRQGGQGENRYAPFYLWDDPAGMDRFLSSEGFADLCRAFGRPSIEIWPLWQAELYEGWRDARYLSIAITPLGRDPSLAEQRKQQLTQANGGALGVVHGYDPGQWRALRASLWATQPDIITKDSSQLYKVGYLATQHG